MGWKLDRFAEIKLMNNVIEVPFDEVLRKNHALKGNWNKEIFKNSNPITVELGCGKGEYTIGQAKKYPERNFIGLDIKGARMWVGAKNAIQEGLSNVRFLRTRIDFVTSFFAKNEVDEIWITFPDPQPQKNRERKRLTAPLFLNRYKEFLRPGGTINLKTDSDFFYHYTAEKIHELGCEIIENSANVHNEMASFLPELQELLKITTYYESIWLEEGKKIKFVKFRFSESK